MRQPPHDPMKSAFMWPCIALDFCTSWRLMGLTERFIGSLMFSLQSTLVLPARHPRMIGEVGLQVHILRFKRSPFGGLSQAISHISNLVTYADRGIRLAALSKP